MRLKFRARAGGVVNWPGAKIQGHLPRYVGRHFVASEKPGVAGAYAADKDAVELDPSSEDAPHLIRQCKKGGLWAADAETAAHCGVEYVNLTQDDDGEWIAARSAPKPAPAKAEPKKEL